MNAAVLPPAERSQLIADIALVLFVHTGQQPQESCRKAEEFMAALIAKDLPAPSTVPFMPRPTLEVKCPSAPTTC